MNRISIHPKQLLRLAGALAVLATARISAQPAAPSQTNPPSTEAAAPARSRVPDLRELMASSYRTNEMRTVSQRYQADRGNLNRYYNVPLSPAYFARIKWFCADWLAALQKIDASKFSEEGRAEHARLVTSIQRELQQLDEQSHAQAEIAPFVPFAKIILDLDESRHRMEKADATKSAAIVDDLAKRIVKTRQSLAGNAPSGNANADGSADASKLSAAQAKRAAETVTTLRATLKTWHSFYNDYDPLFTWWLAQPQKEADQALEEYVAFLRARADRPDASSVTEATTLPNGSSAVTPVKLAGKTPQVPDLNELISLPNSRMRPIIDRFQGNRGGRGGGRGGGGAGGGGGGAGGGGGGAGSGGGGQRGRPQPKEYYQEWLAALPKLDFEQLNHDDQVDYLLLRNRIEYQLRRSDLRNDTAEDTGAFLPFESDIDKLGETQNQPEKVDAAKAVEVIQTLKTQIDSARASAATELEKGDAAAAARAGRAARNIGGLRVQLQEWYDRNSSDWQVNETIGPTFKAADQGLEEYATFLRERSGTSARRDGSDIVGRPIGRDGVMTELAGEMIPYTPEELIAIGENEFAWCVAEMKKAAREMGCGDDWRKAVEKVKGLHVPVGEQPYLIRDLAWEAVDYLEKKDLITIPEIARETWRMQMMSLQRQMVNPFFTGGEAISVSYPLSAMSHDQKLQSMRGNNIPFARATVFHELIPGHELQGFAAARYHTERRGFGTPFYGEGWAVYWELMLYDRNFHGSPENRIGALFWRLHRCARIVFSLKFHLNEWTPQQCIDYLVDQVGHERDNATAEVRRSFGTGYGPMYQAAYLLGALQLRELHQEIVGSHRLSERAFHDAILQEGSMPIAMLRATLTRQPLSPEYQPNWRFYDSTFAKIKSQKR
jgi:uncharacterized protein (DUF885 family)